MDSSENSVPHCTSKPNGSSSCSHFHCRRFSGEVSHWLSHISLLLSPKTTPHFMLQSSVWVNDNISVTWIKAIWGWFPLLTMVPVRSQWGRYNLPRSIPLLDANHLKTTWFPNFRGWTQWTPHFLWLFEPKKSPIRRPFPGHRQRLEMGLQLGHLQELPQCGVSSEFMGCFMGVHGELNGKWPGKWDFSWDVSWDVIFCADFPANKDRNIRKMTILIGKSSVNGPFSIAISAFTGW